jgi:hypothetical protein
MPGMNRSNYMWPDVSEYDKTYETSFQLSDGTKPGSSALDKSTAVFISSDSWY